MKSPRQRRATRSHKFHRAAAPRKQRSRFRQPSKHTTTFDSGFLVPFYLKEILPGDTISLSTTLVARLLTPLYPIMDNIYLDTQFFFVPSRLLWENWEKFHGAQDNPGDSTDFLVPQVTCPAGGWPENSIADYFGLPTKVDGADANALPFRAYNLIRNEWYRDENLQDSSILNKDNGPDLDTDYPLVRRGKRHDYFTSGLPWTQKGDPVEIPIGSTAPVIVDPSVLESSPTTGLPYGIVVENDGNPRSGSGSNNLTGDLGTGQVTLGTSNNSIIYDPNDTLIADLSDATAAKINDLRLAFQTQAYLELNARAGTRYPEYLLAHWGVISDDARLQRPEYLGGGTQNVDIHQVASSVKTGTGDGERLGDLGAFAQSVGGHGFMRSFSEHGYVLGLVSARADMTYQQGMPRMFSRRDVFDFALPIFAHIGEQAILNKEIYFQGIPSSDDSAFAFTERHNEYRYEINKVTGKMRSNATGSLDAWHLALDFSSLPVLSDSFIQEAPPISRVIAVTGEPEFKLDAFSECISTRCLPVRGTPGTLMRF